MGAVVLGRSALTSAASEEAISLYVLFWVSKNQTIARTLLFRSAARACALTIKERRSFCALKKNCCREKWTILFLKITKWQLCGQYTYMVGARTKIVQYHKGYFGPPTQFSPYIACFSFLTQGLLNFESANKINDCRSQRSTFFWERRSAIVCKKSEAKNCKNHNFTVWRMVSDHFFLLQHPLRGRSRPRPQSDLRGRLRPRPQIRPLNLSEAVWGRSLGFELQALVSVWTQVKMVNGRLLNAFMTLNLLLFRARVLRAP